MSASIRFLGVAVLAWAGVRAASLGLVPGLDGMAPIARAATTAGAQQRPAAAPAQSMPAPGASSLPGAAYAPYPPQPGYAAYPPYPPYPPYAYPQPVAVPYYYALPASLPPTRMRRGRPSAWDEVGPTPAPLLEGWGLADPRADERYAAATVEPVPGPVAAPAAPGPAGAPLAKKFDRLQLSAWALLRGSWGPGALATGGTLGGSQVGGRLTYHFTPSLAASLRSSSSVGGVRYAEVAGGVRWKPLASVPVALNFERRQALNRWGGRNAFALFAEGGLYQTPVLGLANLDLYAQGGVVGMKSRDLFFDGAATFTRPLWKRFSAGVGVWGGMQPGLYRVDAGPRLSYDVGRGIRVHADYRQRLAGEAMPSSGPALTIAGDF
jgi:hypothetical protein